MPAWRKGECARQSCGYPTIRPWRTGRGHDFEFVLWQPQTPGTHGYLLLRFLTRHVQRWHTGGHLTQGLQKNGRLTDAGIESIIATAKLEKPKVMVIDSIQTIFTEQLQSAPGGVSQGRGRTGLGCGFGYLAQADCGPERWPVQYLR